jgi:dolichol-phosphate mannosyltransferase
VVKQCRLLGLENWEIIAVDDGSGDRTIDKLHAQAKLIPQLKVISFTRNFGKEAAIHAGLSHAQGGVAVVMDGDGQHPVSLLPDMLERWRCGADVVAACKSARGTESIFSRILASVFYSTFSFLTKIDVRGLSDFMLLDRVVIDQYCALEERHRFFRGMILWMGYSVTKVYFSVSDRAAGESSWSRIKLLRFAANALTGFTSKPLHLISIVSALYALFAVVVGCFTVYQKISGSAVTGFATVNLLILLTGALIMFGLGQIGLYIEQIFEEIKNRPGYLVDRSKSRLGVDEKNQ